MSTLRRALLVGITHYPHLASLHSCVPDARAMRDILAINEGGSLNYDCRLLTGSSDGTGVTTREVIQALRNLFDGFTGDVLFYFSGYGILEEDRWLLVTQGENEKNSELPIDEILMLANNSSAASVLLIIDSCFSPVLPTFKNLANQVQLRRGVTILAATPPKSGAFEAYGHGVFTRLLLGALSGGAADIRGRVSAASIYAYIEQALGPLDQHPLYESSTDQLPPVRHCRSAVPDSLLRDLPSFFESPDSLFRLSPSYEFTHPTAEAEHIHLFNMFKLLRNARLLVPVEQENLYFAALNSGVVKLTSMGQFYWHLAKLALI